MFRLPSFNCPEDNLILGRASQSMFASEFCLSYQERRFHTYVFGLTGWGKSKFLQNCLVQDITSGRGCAVIDPHGDLVKDTLCSLIRLGYFTR
jgi:type IV secretory pathway VirB4 component